MLFRSFESNAAFIRRLLPAMEANGVTLCLENSAKSLFRERFYFFDGTSLAEFCDYFNHPLVGACWDTGHANLEGAQYEEILALGSHLKAIHFNDNYGAADDHVLPFMGTMNVDEVMRALMAVGFSGPFTLEAIGVLRPGKSRRPFLNDTRLIDPPLAVARAHLRNSLEVARVVLDAYGIPSE